MVLWKSFGRHLFEFFLIVYRVHPQYNLLYEKNLTSVLLPFTFPALLHRAGQLETRAFYYYMTIWLCFSLSLQLATLDSLLLLLRGTHTAQNGGGDTGAGQGQKVTMVRVRMCVYVHSFLKV